MRLYVAGHTKDPRVPAIQDRLDRVGHEVYDWANLEASLDRRSQIAAAELEAVKNSDALVLVWHERLLGALLEAGVALGAGLPVLIFDQADARSEGLRRSIFWSLPEVSVVHTVPQIIAWISLALQPHRNPAGSGKSPYAGSYGGSI